MLLPTEKLWSVFVFSLDSSVHQDALSFSDRSFGNDQTDTWRIKHNYVLFPTALTRLHFKISFNNGESDLFLINLLCKYWFLRILQVLSFTVSTFKWEIWMMNDELWNSISREKTWARKTDSCTVRRNSSELHWMTLMTTTTQESSTGQQTTTTTHPQKIISKRLVLWPSSKTMSAMTQWQRHFGARERANETDDAKEDRKRSV